MHRHRDAPTIRPRHLRHAFKTVADALTSGPHDPTQDDTAPGPVTDPFVPSAKTAVPQLPLKFVVCLVLRADLERRRPGGRRVRLCLRGVRQDAVAGRLGRSSTGADAAWVGLDRDDNDPRRLWASVFRCVVCTDP